MPPPNTKPPLDRLPPNSAEAERAVLGCHLLAPEEMPKTLELLKGEEPFYDGRHLDLWRAMVGLHQAAIPLDIITLQQRLKDTDRLESAGGIAYISALQDDVPSAAMLPHYLGICLDKLAVRKMIRACVETVGKVHDLEGSFEPVLAQLHSKVLSIQEMARREVKPEVLRKPVDFAEDIFNKFFGIQGAEEPGRPLPIEFKFRIRPAEMTLCSGDDGCGKSTLLAYFLLHLAAAGEKCAVATFEETPGTYFWTLCSQLLGANRFPNDAAHHRLVNSAIAWLNQRFHIYDFLGIADYRNVLETFRYAARVLGCTVFKLDNAARVGVPEDDMGGQQMLAGALSSFAQQEKAHMFTVLHENKGGNGKDKVRGTKLWTAAAANWFRVLRNTKKGEKIGDIEARIQSERQSREPDYRAIEEEEKQIQALRSEWDAGLILGKQRLRGSQQNASRYFFYCPQSFQYRIHADEPAINWYERWRKRPSPPQAQPVPSQSPSHPIPLLPAP